MEIFNARSVLPTAALLSFTAPPQRTVLQPGDRLYRFGTMTKAHASAIFDSPWWVPEQTFRGITMTAHRTGQSIRDVARSGLAISIPWNPAMDWLFIIELKRPVYGWLGPARPQPVTGDGSTAMFLGNRHQLYVPDLAARGAMSSEAAELRHAGAGWSL